MEKRTYTLEPQKTIDKLAVITVLKMVAETEEEAIKCYENKEITCSPSHPRYKEMIEALDTFGVVVFDKKRIQLPKVENIGFEQRSYT